VELLLDLGDAADRRGVASRLIRMPEVEVQRDSTVVVVKNGKDVGGLDFLEDLEWEGKVGDSADGIMGLGLVGGNVIVERVAAAAPVLLDDRVGERTQPWQSSSPSQRDMQRAPSALGKQAQRNRWVHLRPSRRGRPRSSWRSRPCRQHPRSQ